MCYCFREKKIFNQTEEEKKLSKNPCEKKKNTKTNHRILETNQYLGMEETRRY